MFVLEYTFFYQYLNSLTISNKSRSYRYFPIAHTSPYRYSLQSHPFTVCTGRFVNSHEYFHVPYAHLTGHDRGLVVLKALCLPVHLVDLLIYIRKVHFPFAGFSLLVIIGIGRIQLLPPLFCLGRERTFLCLIGIGGKAPGNYPILKLHLPTNGLFHFIKTGGVLYFTEAGGNR